MSEPIAATEPTLAGLTFLNTRETGSAAALAEPLQERGATVLPAPAIAFMPPEDWAPFDNRLEALTRDDWIVLSSATAVRFMLERMFELNRHPGTLNEARIAAIGTGTHEALREAELRVDLVPRRYQQEALLEALLRRLQREDKVWLPRAAEARDLLPDGLRNAGWPVTVTKVYRTVRPADGLPDKASQALKAGQVDWILFTSSSTVTNFLDMLDDSLWPVLEGAWPHIGCIGEVTAETARRAGLPVAAVPERQSLDGLVAEVEHVVLHGAARGRGGRR